MPGKWIEGEWYTERECAMTDYLQDVLRKLETGREDKINGASPTFKAEPMTDEKIARVISKLDDEFEAEIRDYPSYHKKRSGAETTPDFHRLSKAAQRRVVEGLQQIKHTTTDDKPTVTASGFPITTTESGLSVVQAQPAMDYYEWC